MTSSSRALAIVFFTVVLDLIGFGLVIPLMTFYAESFSASPIEVTLLMTVYSLGQFVAAPLWGQLSDRVGRRPVLVGSIGLTALMLAGFASASALWMLFLFRALHGVMTANISTAQACVADLTTPENRARGMGMIGAAFGLGFTLGPFLGGELSRISLTLPIWVACGLSVVNFLLAAAFLPETRHPGSGAIQRSISPRALGAALSHPVVGGAILLTFLYVFAFAGMESTFTLFAEHHHGLDAQGVGRMFGLIGLIGIVLQGGLTGRLVARFGEARLVPVGLGVMSVGLVLVPFVPLGPPLLGTFALLAIGQGLASPSLHGLISRGADASEQGAILGANQSMSALARASGPILGGVAFQRIGAPAPFVAAAVIVLIAAVLSVPATARAAAARVPGAR